MENKAKLLLNHYIGDNFYPSRQVAFVITENCLKDYLEETEDTRTVKEFLDTYDSDESNVVYGYAADDGRILSEEVTYCDDFEKKYAGFVKRTQMLNPDMTADQVATKEKYYWAVYAQIFSNRLDAKTAASRLNLLFSDASNEDSAFTEVFAEAVKEGIMALEEIQKYHVIGTVEECREAVERMKPKKAIPDKPLKEGYFINWSCPNCGKIKWCGYYYPQLNFDKVCTNCLQAINWSN